MKNRLAPLCLGLGLFFSTLPADDFDLEDSKEKKAAAEANLVEMLKKFVEQKSAAQAYNIASDKTIPSKKLLAKLESPMTMEWKSTPLNEVCKDLRDFLEINVVIHKDVNKETLVDMNVKEMKGLNVVRWILRTQDLRGTVIDGILFITPIDKAPIKHNNTLVIYDVNDLTNVIRDFPAPKIDTFEQK